MARARPTPELVELVKALARAAVARNIAESSAKKEDNADGHLRPVLQQSAK